MRECCAAPDKAKDIIRVVINGSSGYGLVDEAFILISNKIAKHDDLWYNTLEGV